MVLTLKNDKPLVVDFDGTLIHGDHFRKSIIGAIRARPFLIWRLVKSFLMGRQEIKKNIHDAGLYIHVGTLCPNKLVVDFISKHEDRKIVFCSGGYSETVESYIRQLGYGDEYEVFGSSKVVNLTKKAKARFLIERYGEKNFDYIGNSLDDIPVWKSAQEAYCVCSPAKKMIIELVGGLQLRKMD